MSKMHLTKHDNNLSSLAKDTAVMRGTVPRFRAVQHAGALDTLDKVASAQGTDEARTIRTGAITRTSLVAASGGAPTSKNERT